jgi:hypothetical protein
MIYKLGLGATKSNILTGTTLLLANPLDDIALAGAGLLGIHRLGLGASGSPILNMNTAQLASFATSTAGSIAAGILALSPATGPAAPFVAIGAALTALLISQFQGCGQTCILTSDAANQVEQLLQQNLSTYMASGHTVSEQAAALQVFDNAWSQLEQYCGQSQFGSAGTNCIQDREAGACKWKASPGGWSNGVYIPWGASGSGNSCWNWFIGYRDPIANDPTVVPDASVSDTVSGAVSNGVVSLANIVGNVTGPEIAIFAVILGGIFLI